MLNARFSHLYFYQSLNRLQRGLSAIAELLVINLTRVSTPTGCHPAPILPVQPCLSTILCKFAHKKFPSGVTSLEGVTRGGPPPVLPSDATESCYETLKFK